MSACGYRRKLDSNAERRFGWRKTTRSSAAEDHDAAKSEVLLAVRCVGPEAIIGDRERDVCSRCQTVFYQNPLPVAAAVVVNEKREVLLVRRKSDPQRGMWCLPIGFAELNETIEQAAVRELREEAGITGRVLRLLEVDSYQSDFYGDLRIVSFEVEYLSGAPAAGDDAEEVAFHPLANTPPLAFAANEQALRAYLAHPS